jgi:hypothetical protein
VNLQFSIEQSEPMGEPEKKGDQGNQGVPGQNGGSYRGSDV